MSDHLVDCLSHTKIESNPWWLIPVAIGIAALVTGLLFWWITDDLPPWAWILMIIGVVFICIGIITFILTKSRVAKCYLGLNKQKMSKTVMQYVPESISIPSLSLVETTNPIPVMLTPVGIPNIPQMSQASQTTQENIINTNPVIPSRTDSDFSSIMFNE